MVRDGPRAAPGRAGLSPSLTSFRAPLSAEFEEAIRRSVLDQVDAKSASIRAHLEAGKEGSSTAEWAGEGRAEDWAGPQLQWITDYAAE